MNYAPHHLSLDDTTAPKNGDLLILGADAFDSHTPGRLTSKGSVAVYIEKTKSNYAALDGCHVIVDSSRLLRLSFPPGTRFERDSMERGYITVLPAFEDAPLYCRRCKTKDGF